MEEINGHTGLVWTFINSLKREDAHRLGYENSKSWRRLLLAHQAELAQAMKITAKQLPMVCRLPRRKTPPPHSHDGLVGESPKQGFSDGERHRGDALPAVQ